VSNYLIADSTVLIDLWKASGGNIATATQLFDTLLQPNATLVITDTIKAEVTTK
jgi:hypothetical protein